MSDRERGRWRRKRRVCSEIEGMPEQYIMADHLPPHNYGVRAWGVGFEMSPDQYDIAGYFDRHHSTPLHIPPRHENQRRTVMRPTMLMGPCLWR